MRIRRLLLQSVAYTLYALLAFVVFLYVTFPYDLLRQRLVEWVSQGGIILTMARLRPAFPPGLHAQGVRLLLAPFSPNDAALQIESVHLQPEWTALWARHMQVHFEARLYSGRVDGKVRYAQVEGAPLWDVTLRFADLDVAQHALVRPFFRGRLSGESTVVFNHDGQVHDGTLHVRWQPLVLTAIPGLPWQFQREVVCDALQGEVKANSRQGGTVSLTCQDKNLALDARGTMGWQTPLLDSQLNLRWQVRSDEAYRQEVELLAALVRKRPDRRGELSFRLQGPLRQLRLGA